MKWQRLLFSLMMSVSLTGVSMSAWADCPDEATIQSEIASDESNCQNLHDSAQSCCQNPTQCSGIGSMSGGSDMSSLIKIMMTMAASSLMAQSSPGQMQDMSTICNMFGGVTGAGGGMNGSMVSMCSSGKNQCVSSCTKAANFWRNLANQSGSCGAVVQDMNSASSALMVMETQCEGYVGNTMVAGQANNFNGANQGAMQNVCGQMGMQPQSMLQPMAPPQQMLDCTNPVNAASPSCQSCQQGNYYSQPCVPAQVVRDGGSTGATFAQQAATSSTNPGNYDVATSSDITKQGPQFANPNDNKNAAAAAPASPYPPPGYGGGNTMLNNAGAFNPLPPPQPLNHGAYGVKHNTDILLGERGGNGYTTGSMQVDTSNGFQGYGTGQDPQAAAAGLDLRRYLPGHSMDPNRRVAGVGSASPDIATTGTDIFKRISDRFKLICGSNRLLDCQLPQRSN